MIGVDYDAVAATDDMTMMVRGRGFLQFLIHVSPSPYLFFLEDPLDGGCRLTLHIDVKLNIASSLDGGLFEVCAVDARLDC